jgi:hypothetical protein
MTADTPHLCADLSAAARQLHRLGLPTRDFIDTLIDEGHSADAIRVLAQALPKAEAVAWACDCIRQVMPNLRGAAETAWQAAAEWAKQPSEERRRRAKASADAVGLEHPAGAVATAAFLSGGSLAPAELPAVPPAEHLTARAVAGAVLLAAAWDGAESADNWQRRFLDLGLGRMH